MAKLMKVVPKSTSNSPALEVALQGARRATGDATSSVALADPEVVAIAKRRQFSPSEKRRILERADSCTQPGQIGALLRREGIYSSHLSTWRKRRTAGHGFEAGKRGRSSHCRSAPYRQAHSRERTSSPATGAGASDHRGPKKSIVFTRLANGRRIGRDLLMQATHGLAVDVGVARACRVMKLDRCAIYRQRDAARVICLRLEHQRGFDAPRHWH